MSVNEKYLSSRGDVQTEEMTFIEKVLEIDSKYFQLLFFSIYAIILDS